MKKYLLPIVITTGLVLSACGGGSDSEPVTEETPMEETTVEDTPTEDSAPERSDEQKAADYEAWLKSQLGVQEFSELLASDPTLWGGWINGIVADRDRMHVRLQVDRNDADSKDFAKRAAKSISMLVKSSDDERVSNVDWVVVDDGAGNYLAQESV